MALVVLLKAHVGGYVKKDGTVVKPHDDKRAPKKASFFDNYAKFSKHPGVAKPPQTAAAPQLGLFGFGAAKAAPKAYPNAAPHPAKKDTGETVKINEPSIASAPETWSDPAAEAVFVPGGQCPESLNGIAFAPWADAPRDDDAWDYVAGQMDDLEEPPLHVSLGKKAASGVVIEEPDGRIWLVSPTNAFGGYDSTYPKGKAEEGLSLQANAIKEAFEESGLQVEITGLLGDFERTTSVTRLYRARRVGGSPAAVGWESQAVRLVPRAMLDAVADHHNDHEINSLLKQ